jgi:solute carrier family 25 citrate transporter 1
VDITRGHYTYALNKAPVLAAKTRAQLERRVPAEKLPAVKPGIKGWYAGYAATVTGTTVKAAVRE